MFESWDWRQMMQELVVYAGQNPWSFLYYVLLCLSPFFAVSALLAWQLAKQIESKDKEKKKIGRRNQNINRARKRKKEE